MNDEQDIAFNSFNNFVINTKNKVLDMKYIDFFSFYIYSSFSYLFVLFKILINYPAINKAFLLFGLSRYKIIKNKKHDKE